MSSTRSNHSPPLPLEIVERILEGIHDRESLKNCSLISKSFLRPSQKILFQNIELSLAPDDAKKARNRNDSPHDIPTQIMDFLISSPIHSSMVSKIHISGKDIPIEATSTSIWKSTIDGFRVLLPQLTRLRQVTIESSFISDWTMINPHLKDALLGFYALSTLQHLELRYTRIAERELACMFRIPRLTLVGVNLIMGPELTSNNFKLSEGADVCVTELKIVLRGSEMAQWMLCIAKASQSTLKSLSWHTPSHLRDISRIPSGMSISDFTSLKFLSICIPVGASTIEDLILLFKHQEGSQAHLKTIQLILEKEYIPDEIAATWDSSWQELDMLLSSPAYAELETLHISINTMFTYQSLSTRGQGSQSLEPLSLFRSRLPSLVKRGVCIEAMDTSI